MSTINTTPTNAQNATPPMTEAQIEREFKARDQFGDYTKVALYEQVTDSKTGETKGLLHIMNPYDPDAVVVTLPTQATKEQVEQITPKIAAIPEFCEMFAKLAECYQLRYPLMIEGGTAIGKTYCVNKFVELMYGKGVKSLDFYCSGQTDVGDLIGKWIPNEGASSETVERWGRFISSEAGQAKLAAIDETVRGAGDALSDAEKARMYQAQLAALAKEIGIKEEKGFIFSLGAVPKAFEGEYVDGRFVAREGGRGFFCHIQEPGLAKPAVLNALLRIRGEQGGVADSIQLWEDGGRLIRSGPDTFFVFSNNPSDGYLDRKPVDPALARGMEWLRFGEGLSEQSVKMIARRTFTYKLGNDDAPRSAHAVLDLRKAPELGLALAEAMVPIHQIACNYFNKDGASDDPQRNPVVMDNLVKVAAILQNHQVKDDQGRLDVGKSLMRAITRTYLERARPEERESLSKLIEQRIDGTTSQVEFEGKTITLAQKLNMLASRAMQANAAATPPPNGNLTERAGAKATEAFMGELKDILGELKG